MKISFNKTNIKACEDSLGVKLSVKELSLAVEDILSYFLDPYYKGLMLVLKDTEYGIHCELYVNPSKEDNEIIYTESTKTEEQILSSMMDMFSRGKEKLH